MRTVLSWVRVILGATAIRGAVTMRTSAAKIRRSTLWMMLIVMPVGVRIDGPSDSELTLEGHVGTGQVYSILRNCEGNTVASEKNTYSDFAGAIQYSLRTGDGNFIVLGLRGGRFQSEYRYASREPSLVEPYDYEYSYWNPHVALETPYVGVGIGYMSEALAIRLGDRETTPPVSAHLRFGNYSAAYFLATLNENLPLASGGGYYNLGIGYPVSNKVRMFTGLTAGPYDRPGVVQKVSWQLSERFDLDLNGRFGKAGGNPEFGISIGLRYHLPLGAKGGRNQFLEKQRMDDTPKKEHRNWEIGSLDAN